MVWLFVLALVGVCGLLWSRLQRIERRLDANEGLLDLAMRRLRALEGEGTAAKAEGVTLTRTSDTAVEAKATEPEPETPQPATVSLARSHTGEAFTGDAQETEEFNESALSMGIVDRLRAGLDFEDIFGRRLPIWAGGVALAVAGVFMVRWSIERGLLTPEVRVILAFLFGVVLLAGAELAYRFEERVADPRVRQALAGAGLATLYASFYLAGTQYGLIGQTFAFLGLAAVTAAAIAMSYRFGLPSAVLGLIGGFAAPMLVGSEEPNLPLLTLYLGLVTAGLVLTGRRQDRPWLGITAMAGGLGWGALLLLSGGFGWKEVFALGLYFIVLGAVLPAMLVSKTFEVPLRLASAGVASVQSALLVGQAGYPPLGWGLYLLLGAALGWLAWNRKDLRPALAFAATTGLAMLAHWSAPDPRLYAAVAAALAVLFAGLPLAQVARGEASLPDKSLIAAFPPLFAAVNFGTFSRFDPNLAEPILAVTSLALGLVPAAAAYLRRDSGAPLFFALWTATAALLAFAALLLVSPSWMAPVMAALTAIGVAALLRAKGGPALANVLWGAGVVALGALAFSSGFGPETGLWGADEDPRRMRALIRWLAAATPFAALAWLEPRRYVRDAAEALAALLVYAALSQVLPWDSLAWMAALLSLAAWAVLKPRFAAQGALATVALCWALSPLARTIGTAFETLVGDVAYVIDLPGPRAALLRILPAAAALGLLAIPNPAQAGRRIPAWPLGAALVGIVSYILFKQVFAIETVTAFVVLGMAERTVWQALLLGAGLLAALDWPKLGSQRALSTALIGAALAHFALFTLGLHNPLWHRQAVGPVPLANLVLAAYAIAVAGMLTLKPRLPEKARPWLDGVVMATVALGTLSLLRQAFAGSIMADAPMTQAEDLLRSLLGILLALGFLFLGMRRGERSWRVGSLVLMLVAVIKVFLLDAAGLEGLLRPASFAALGAALIGIGWLYTRLLKRVPTDDP